MSKTQPDSSVSKALRFFISLQFMLATGGLALALAPFLLIWTIGSFVDHNTNFFWGVTWYALFGLLCLVLQWVLHKIHQVPESGVYSKEVNKIEKLLSAGSTICLPVVMYLCVRVMATDSLSSDEQVTSLNDLSALINFFLRMHADVVSVGLYSTLFSNDTWIISLSFWSKLFYFFMRSLYSLGIIVIVRQYIFKKYLGFRDIIGSISASGEGLAYFMYGSLIYHFFVIGATAFASQISGWTGLIAAQIPTSLHFFILVFIPLLLPAIQKVREAARRSRSKK